MQKIENRHASWVFIGISKYNVSKIEYRITFSILGIDLNIWINAVD